MEDRIKNDDSTEQLNTVKKKLDKAQRNNERLQKENELLQKHQKQGLPSSNKSDKLELRNIKIKQKRLQDELKSKSDKIKALEKEQEIMMDRCTCLDINFAETQL